MQTYAKFSRGYQPSPPVRLKSPTQAPVERKNNLAASSVSRSSNTFAHDFSQIPINPPPQIQAKLTINASGDAYEREADRVSRQIMRMPEPVQPIEYDFSKERLQPPVRQPRYERSRLQIGRMTANDIGQVSAPPTVQEVLATPGQPLDQAARLFMEQRFGKDFGHVRVHTDARAAASAEAMNALAYTVGQHVAFGAGRYQPNTSAGRVLLAHELSHTIQQGNALHGMRPVIQRALKFEFQTDNKVTTTEGRKIPRKYGKFLHLGKTGVRLETDTGGVMEFETGGWEKKWSKLKALIQEAVDIVGDIKKKGGKDFAFSEAPRLAKEGKLKKGEKLVVNITDAHFIADIQSSEGIELSQYESFLKEHEIPTFKTPVIDAAQKILDAAKAANPKIKPSTNTDDLRGFLQVIVNYIKRGQGVPSKITKVSPVKARFRLMHRTNFSSMFNSLLGPEEQELFKQIVKSNAIPLQLGLSQTDPFFIDGYWGHIEGMMALIQDGKIEALATEDQQTIHDCSSKAKTAGIKTSLCGKKVANSDITVGAWLKSIIGKKKDALSPPPGGSAAMGGEGDVKTRGKNVGLALFETRGTEARNRSQPVDKWVDYVEEVFLEAAVCRPRPGSKTELKYDGSKTFDPANCP